MARRTPYSGTERKLVLAFDVGTTYSGISYTILDPGRVPEIIPVTRFPGWGKVGGDAKVPTVVYYDSAGVPRAIGAETEREGIDGIADESQWTKAEWFKLHLRPNTKATASISEEIPKLPRGKTAVDIFADFLNYLNQCARSYIEETHVDGASLLSSGKVEFILSHPNAWEGAQQTLMKNAAIQAGLIPDSASGRDRISFISEGEASLNSCIDKDLTNESIRRGEGVTIVDAGGGTLDISTYALKTGSDREYDEIAETQSYFKGSIFVSRAAAKYLDEFLKKSRFYEDAGFMAEKFDKSTKLTFRDPTDPQFIKFSNRVKDRDPEYNIRNGQLRLDGNLIAEFFEPSIQCIIDAILEQRRLASKPVSTVFLVGGFAASDYLFTQLKERLKSHGLSIHRPDSHVNKAVADGAIVGFLSPTVRSRVAKFSYGIKCNVAYDPSNIEHMLRMNSCVQFLSGRLGVPDAFGLLLKKGTQVSQTEVFRKSFFVEQKKKGKLPKESKTFITVYRGSLPPPSFFDQDTENFHDVFEVRADLSAVINSLQKVTGIAGNKYFKLSYDIVILFGSTEFKAQYAWYENGVEKRGPAEILFDTDIVYQV